MVRATMLLLLLLLPLPPPPLYTDTVAQVLACTDTAMKPFSRATGVMAIATAREHTRPSAPHHLHLVHFFHGDFLAVSHGCSADQVPSTRRRRTKVWFLFARASNKLLCKHLCRASTIICLRKTESRRKQAATQMRMTSLYRSNHY
jgi:hypothetical protein